MAKKNRLKWYETEYFRADETIQPVEAGGRLLYTLFSRHGYNYVFYTVKDIMEYLNEGKQCWLATFETEDEMTEWLEKYGIN